MERKEWKIEAWMCAELEEGEAALVLVWKVWLCRVVNVKKVSRESRWKVFVQNQRRFEALTWLSLAGGEESEGRIKCFLRAQTRHQWVKSPLLGPNLGFYFPFLTFGDAGGCWYSLIVTSSVCPLRPRCVHPPAERWKSDWHHPKYQMIWMEKE